MITNPKHQSLTLKEDGSFATTNSTVESLRLESYVPPSGDITVSGNATYNGNYTPNGTHGGETAYEGASAWIYVADGYWCLNPTKTTYYYQAEFTCTKRLGTYRQTEGTNTLAVTQGDSSDETINAKIIYAKEVLTDVIHIGSSFFDYDSYPVLRQPGTNNDPIALTHNDGDIVNFPQDGEALAINSAVTSYSSVNAEDLANETDFTDNGSWVPNGLVHVKSDTKTPNTYTNNVIGIDDANTVHICGWEVTSPSEASRYPTSLPTSPKEHELAYDPDEGNLKIYTKDTLTDGTEYGNTWLRLSYNFPSFKPMYNQAYEDGYKLALSRTAGDLKDYPLNPTVESVTLNASASSQLHSGAGFTVGNKIVFTGSGNSGNCAVVDLSDNSYTSFDQTSWNTSNGLVGFDGKTIFLTTNIGGCQYFEPNPTSNSDITGVDANGTANNEWVAATCGPTPGNTVYGLVYNSSANETYVVKQVTYPSASSTSGDNTLNTSSGQNWLSMSLTYTGNIYSLPATANGDVLKIDTTDQSVSTINITDCPAVRQTILAPNGMLYGFPDDYSSNVIRFDPYTEEATLLDAVGTTNETRHQGYCGADGHLYIFPDDLASGAETIVFDPTTDTAEIVELPTSTTENYLTILPGAPGVFYRLDNQGKYMHIIKFFQTLADYDDYWKYTHYNSR